MGVGAIAAFVSACGRVGFQEIDAIRRDGGAVDPVVDDATMADVTSEPPKEPPGRDGSDEASMRPDGATIDASCSGDACVSCSNTAACTCAAYGGHTYRFCDSARSWSDA